jgi:hypothetical protein
MTTTSSPSAAAVDGGPVLAGRTAVITGAARRVRRDGGCDAARDAAAAAEQVAERLYIAEATVTGARSEGSGRGGAGRPNASSRRGPLQTVGSDPCCRRSR